VTVDPREMAKDFCETMLALGAWWWAMDAEGDDLGEAGGVGSAKKKGLSSGTGSWATGRSALGLGVVPDDEKVGTITSSSLGRDGEHGEWTTGIG
jgi:hypothetical protein